MYIYNYPVSIDMQKVNKTVQNPLMCLNTYKNVFVIDIYTN